jgi:twitching motility protein PilT
MRDRFEPLTAEQTRVLATGMMDERQRQSFENHREVDFAYSLSGVGRFRVNVFHQRGSVGMTLRRVATERAAIEDLGLPPVIRQLADEPRGLILVTGTAGSGKTTTLAAMIDHVNSTREGHIVTIEDPIEVLHHDKKCIVNQREIGVDTANYATALRAALREDPDVILIGEMRDLETISIALTAAETGHLVLSTLHTTGAAKTIDRVIDVFPPYQQQQVRLQLSMTLVGVLSQQLLLSTDNKARVLAVESMVATPAIRNLIRENKIHQVASAMQASAPSGNQLMDNSLSQLYRSGKISRETAFAYSMDKNYISTLL